MGCTPHPLALPPLSSRPRRREAVTPDARADPARRLRREGVAREERLRRGLAVQELPHEVDEPGLLVDDLAAGGAVADEPHLPVEPVVVRRDEARAPPGVARHARQLVLLPGRVQSSTEPVARPFEDHLVALAAHAAEGAVGVDHVERIVGRVHRLLARREVQDGSDAEHPDDDAEHLARARLGRRRREELEAPGRLAQGAPEGPGHGPRRREDHAVVEAREGGDDREPVQEGEIPARDEKQLEADEEEARDVAHATEPEREPGDDELHEVVHEHAALRGPRAAPGEGTTRAGWAPAGSRSGRRGR